VAASKPYLAKGCRVVSSTKLFTASLFRGGAKKTEKTPSKMPVPGENPELDAETSVPTLVGVSIGLVSVSTLVVSLRLYTRCFVVRSPGADDLTIGLAQILSIGVSIVTILRQ